METSSTGQIRLTSKVQPLPWNDYRRKLGIRTVTDFAASLSVLGEAAVVECPSSG